MSTEDLLEELEAGIEHDIAVNYLKENPQASVNDVLYFLGQYFRGDGQ